MLRCTKDKAVMRGQKWPCLVFFFSVLTIVASQTSKRRTPLLCFYNDCDKGSVWHQAHSQNRHKLFLHVIQGELVPPEWSLRKEGVDGLVRRVAAKPGMPARIARTGLTCKTQYFGPRLSGSELALVRLNVDFLFHSEPKRKWFGLRLVKSRQFASSDSRALLSQHFKAAAPALRSGFSWQTADVVIHLGHQEVKQILFITQHGQK